MRESLCVFFTSAFFLIQLTEAGQPFILGHLEGQLGNQFFQIAATVSLALDHDAQPIFPDLENKSQFNIPINYKYVFSRLNSSAPHSFIEMEYKEPYFHFTPIPYHANMSLRGWFQSEKYFKKHKEAILQLFAPSEEIKTYLKDRYSDILKHPKTVSIHVRMYKDTSPEYHPFVGWNYINKAVRCFPQDSLFVIFSDEITFCKRKLRKILKDKKVVFIEGNHPSHICDLYLMSMCKHHIISNSSFSWWGAYLNQNPEKIVIAPSPLRWFGPEMKGFDTTDILPQEWEVLL